MELRSEQVGAYRLLEPLGRGGKGIVYRARHETSGRTVVVKMLRAADPADVESFRREAFALSRVRHPGVVRVLDQGLASGVPWFAMELVEGRPFDPTASDALGAVRRLCAPLAFLHGDGIVHRDLKPGNVIVRHDGLPVLVDFGLMGRFGGALSREALEVGGEILGTIAYMAPEQARGEYVDARADLYSLGCMLYEVLAGRAPFTGSPWEILTQHLEARPLPPSAHAAVAPALDALVMRLLEKDPRLRLGYAADVARALDGDHEADALEVELRAARPYLYRPSFVGRRDLLHRLSERLDGATQGRGGCILVSGESGSGKTRLAMEVTREATRRGCRVVVGECAAPEGTLATSEVRGAPLHPLRPLLRTIADACRVEGPGATRRLLGRRAKVLAAYEESLTGVPGWDELPEPPALSAQAARSRLLADVADTMAACAADRPLLLVLDDLQWADDLTLALLGSLPGEFFERARLVVVGTYRSEEMHPALRTAADSPAVEVLEIGRMELDTISTMVGDMLAMRPPPPPLVRFLAQESEGNPFFVSEYLRTAIGAQLLTRAPSGQWEPVAEPGREPDYQTLPLPHTLHELVGRRLEHLDPVASAVLEAAAVLGREFDLDLAAALTHLDEAQRLGAVTQLMTRQVVEQAAGTNLRFAHDKIREAAYARLAAPRAAALHGAAASAIERRHAADADFAQRYATLAHHWSMAGVDDRALHYLGLAGEHAHRTGAHSDARELLARALALDHRLGSPSGRFQRVRWERMLGDASIGIGDLDACIAHMGEALRGLRVVVPTSRTGWAAVLGVELVRQVAHRVLPPGLWRSGRGSDGCAEGALAASQMATSHYFQGDVLRAIPNLLRAVNLGERGGGAASLPAAYGRLGYVSGAAGLDRVARSYMRRAYALAAEGGDVVARGIVLWNDAMYLLGRAQWAQSRAVAEESIAILRGAGDQQEAEIGLMATGHAYYYQGQFAPAQASFERLTEWAQARSNRQHAGWGVFLRGRTLLARGDDAAAIALCEAGRAALGPLSTIDRTSTMCDGLLARAVLATGDRDRARGIAAELFAGLQDRPPPPAPPLVDAYGSLAEVTLALWATDRTTAAAQMARRATQMLRRFARVWPIAEPNAWRCVAWEHRLSGRDARARAAWMRAIDAAGRRDMPYEAARAHADLARHAAGAEERGVHAGAAARLFGELGCRRAAVEAPARDGDGPA